MKAIIGYEKWLWITLFTLVLLAGIGFMVQIFEPKPNFEKAAEFVIGLFMLTGGGYGVLHNIFGEKKAETICTWIYGTLMALAGVAFFATLIIGGIVGLVKIIV
jgi:hypothetical protein